MKNKNFDFIAPYYDFLSKLIFGDRLRIAQISLLSKIPKHQRILLVGGGTGWILPELLQICEPSEIVYIEKSAEMISLSKKQVSTNSPIVWVCGGEEQFKEYGSFDIVFTPFFLDLFPEPWLDKHIVSPLVYVLKPSGFWLLVDFFPTSHLFFTFLTKIMYTFFRMVSGVTNAELADYPKLLSQNKLTLTHSEEWMNGYVKAQVWQKGD
ncbi:class I SAM-dependent methyltransferase [Flectobacillus roseus]|uniref:Class I SAM-dependent methyltransferase n=1 Tax=Flectobacillus roseus TaxID=502259 RepID=A0ABT6Y3P0_9BACT|nr:class I SAM-dependent methyltransferase [Flectobacillus roseus]MDI9858188.1 class I SAM-dependent methyltransferase [Flectobacillus roseus]